MNFIIETYHSPYTKERVGGAETSLKLIAEELVKKDHNVIFISKSFTTTWLGIKVNRVHGVHVIIFTKFKFQLLNSYKFKKVSRYFKNKFIRYKLKHIDIVHTYNNLGIISYYAEQKPFFKFKLVIRMAGLKLFEDFERKPELIAVCEKHLNSVDLYNFISRGLLKLVNDKSRELHLKIDFNPNFVQDIGVDLSQLPIKAKQYVSKDNTFKMVMASRLSIYQKRQDVLIKAMTYLKNDNIELFIIGEGPNLSNLQKLAAAEGVAEKIIFMPFKQGIWDSLIDFDLLVHACDYEGLSKIIIESMGVGLPVLASNVSPLNTYISDEINGFLVNNDPKEWADKIRSIVLKSSLLQDVAQNSKCFIEESYTSYRNINVYLHYFENIIKQQNEGL